nr:peptide chain release factor N(5)-glutamine methyltransferase [Nocardia sp. CNY236]
MTHEWPRNEHDAGRVRATPPAQLRLRPAIDDAIETLRASGVPSPQADAEQLAAHVLGITRTRLALTAHLSPGELAEFHELIASRARRIPLQHLTGTAPMGELDIAVGPGVLIPRPETELLLAWALEELKMRRRERRPIVVDLCAGSGALALALAHACPDAEVHAVEVDREALRWAQRNADDRVAAGDTPITLHAADVTDPELLFDLRGRVDVVVSNPPYIPQDARLEPEVAEYDPPIALFGGRDGLDVIRAMIPNVAALLRDRGVVAIEHDDSQGATMTALMAERGDFTDLVEHPDLAGKPRFVTACRVTRHRGSDTGRYGVR